MSKKTELTEKLEKASELVTDAVKAAAKKAEPAVQKAVEKAEPTVKKAVEKAEPTVKKAEQVLKTTSRKAASALTPEIYLQWGGREISYAEIAQRVREDFKAQYTGHKGAIRSCKIYIKPEDNTAYYVINKIEGKVEL